MSTYINIKDKLFNNLFDYYFIKLAIEHGKDHGEINDDSKKKMKNKIFEILKNEFYKMTSHRYITSNVNGEYLNNHQQLVALQNDNLHLLKVIQIYENMPKYMKDYFTTHSNEFQISQNITNSKLLESELLEFQNSERNMFRISNELESELLESQDSERNVTRISNELESELRESQNSESNMSRISNELEKSLQQAQINQNNEKLYMNNK